MRIGLIAFIFALCVAAAIVGQHFLAPPRAHVAAGLDRSGSVKRNTEGLQQEVRTVLESKPGFQEGSTLSFLVSGEGLSNPEPELAFSGSIPVSSGDIFGKEEQEEARRAAETKLFAGLSDAIESALTSRGSAIYQLMKQGIAHLRAAGCTAKGACFFIAQTDLDDDVHPALRKAIERSAKSVSLPSELARSIDNAGIEVSFCGTSEIQPRREGKRVRPSPETLARIWKQIFTHPELVSIRPFCGQ